MKDVMSKANILFLYATQATSTRKWIYVEACRELTRAYGHKVVFCYNGPKIAGIEDLRVEHFESWVDQNHDRIQRESLRALERRFPQSNLWRSVVIERNLTDYSYVGASSMSSTYSLPEIEWYLKALVLFYDYVFDRYEIDVAFNQVSDNIHAHVVYELARSKEILPLSVGRGLYWFDDMIYPQTELNFGSDALRDRYRFLRTNCGSSSAERNEWLEQQIVKFCSTEASEKRPNIIYSKTIWTMTMNALLGLRESFGNLRILRPSVLESNLYLSFWATIKAYVVRCWNLGASRLVRRARSLPEDPFVFLPLHYQPEAALLGASPGYLDQLALVRLLSASLPAGYRLVVKDHPVTGGTHGPAFYRSMKKLGNVVLMDEGVSGRVITRAANCALVASIGGTVGLEAMLSGKPVLLFGRTYYDCVDTLLKPPGDLNDLPLFMKRTLVFGEHPRSDEIAADGRTFLTAFLSIMTPAGKATYWAQDDTMGAGRDWARLVHELILQVKSAEVACQPVVQRDEQVQTGFSHREHL